MIHRVNVGTYESDAIARIARACATAVRYTLTSLVNGGRAEVTLTLGHLRDQRCRQGRNPFRLVLVSTVRHIVHHPNEHEVDSKRDAVESGIDCCDGHLAKGQSCPQISNQLIQIVVVIIDASPKTDELYKMGIRNQHAPSKFQNAVSLMSSNLAGLARLPASTYWHQAWMSVVFVNDRLSPENE